MKLHWIGTLVAMFTSVLMLMGQPATDPQKGAAASPNVWGGRGVNMETTPEGANLEFDCAHGDMQEAIKANAKGEFVARGTYTPEHGGPITRDNPAGDLPATYSGIIDGDTMRLKVELAEQDQAPGPFTLTRGKPGRLVKCR